MLLDSQFRLLNSLCRVSHDSHCRPGPHFSPVSRWIDNEGEWPSRWQPPATPWPHMSDVWVPQHRRAVIWCMWTSTASQLIDWGDAGTACGRAVLRRFVEVCALLGCVRQGRRRLCRPGPPVRDGRCAAVGAARRHVMTSLHGSCAGKRPPPNNPSVTSGRALLQATPTDRGATSSGIFI